MRSRPDVDPAAAWRYLEGRVGWIELLLTRLAAEVRGDDRAAELQARIAEAEARLREEERATPSLPIHALRARAPLSGFEEAVLWLGAAAAQDRHIRELAAVCAEDGRKTWPTVWLCLRLLCPGRTERLQALRALNASGPLASLGFVRLRQREDAEPDALDREVVVPPCIVHLLRSERALPNDLAGVARLVRPRLRLDAIALSDEDLAGLKTLLAAADGVNATAGSEHYDPCRGALLLVAGPRGSGKSLAVRSLAAERGARLVEVDCALLGERAPQAVRAALAEAVYDAAFTGDWLLLDGCDRLLGAPDAQSGVTATLLAEVHRWPATVFLTAERPDLLPVTVRERLLAQHELGPLGSEARGLAWQLNVPERVELGMGLDFRALAETYPLSGRRIQNALRLGARSRPDGELGQDELRRAAMMQQAAGFGDVAQRTFVQRRREDLLLPPDAGAQIDEIVRTERVRSAVLYGWGMAARLQKGLGLACLFDGEPGTGKTLSAEVIASELGLQLYTVNVASVMSKWVGETEKNLQRIFDEAHKTRCVLLFDEADTLFARRTSVDHANDRHANMEVGLLLQLVEAHRGLVVLTTNLRENMDPALNRRLHFKVSFPFPDAGARERIWLRLLPADRLEDGINIKKLARQFELAGGSIRNVVLRSAYRAAIEDRRIAMADLCDVAGIECQAMGRLVRQLV